MRSVARGSDQPITEQELRRTSIPRLPQYNVLNGHTAGTKRQRHKEIIQPPGRAIRVGTAFNIGTLDSSEVSEDVLFDLQNYL
jgi:hypothetical protein